MKKLLYLLIVSSSFFACEDVIEIETPEEPPRLSVDALIRVQDSAATTTIKVGVRLTSSFFEPTAVANLNQITITNLDAPTDMGGNIIVLIEEEEGIGIYEKTVDTSLLTEGRLQLSISYEDEIYIAETRYVPTEPIASLTQGTETLFAGDEKEIIVAFNDNATRDDFYLFDFDFNEYLVTEDEFYQGQRFEFSYFYDNQLNTGDEVTISILGADEGFYNYMNQLIVQAGGDQGPFETPAATVRGNIINASNIDNETVFDNVGQPENFVLGYFAVVQQFSETIIIE